MPRAAASPSGSPDGCRPTAAAIELRASSAYHPGLTPFPVGPACPQPNASVIVIPNPRSPEAVKLRIAELQLEHRGLDQVIRRMAESTDSDELQLRRLKKRKLQIKDTIVLLQMQLTPDVPA